MSRIDWPHQGQAAFTTQNTNRQLAHTLEDTKQNVVGSLVQTYRFLTRTRYSALHFHSVVQTLTCLPLIVAMLRGQRT